MARSHNRNKRKFGDKLCVVLSVGLFILAIIPFGDWLLMPLEHKFPSKTPDRVDGIIMLSGDESPALSEALGEPVVGSVAGRYVTFATLAKKYPEAKLVFSGGSYELVPVKTKLTNKEVANDILSGLGIKTDRMVFENKSRNTYENAVFSTELVKPKPEQNWLLVTSAYHMPRAVVCFRKAGWNVFPESTDYKTSGVFRPEIDFNLFVHMGTLNIALREYIGLVYYWLMGRIDWPW